MSHSLDHRLKNLNVGEEGVFGPEDKLQPEVIDRAKAFAIKKMVSAKAFDIDNVLEPDPEMLRGEYKYAIVSFIGPYPILHVKHDVLQLCIRDYAKDIQQAQRKVLNLKRRNDMYCIYLFEMYSWIAVPPNETFMKNQMEHDKFLFQLVLKNMYAFEVQKRLFDIRKEKMSSNPDLNKDKGESEDDIQNEDDNEDDNEDESENESDEIEEGLLEELLQLVDRDTEDITRLFDSDTKQEESVSFDSDEKLYPGEKEVSAYAILTKIGDDKKGYALKIRGVFTEESKARAQVEKFYEIDPVFENYIVECYRWLPLRVSPDDIDDQVYGNEILDTMHTEYKTQKQKAQEYLIKKTPDQPSPDELYHDMITNMEGKN